LSRRRCAGRRQKAKSCTIAEIPSLPDTGESENRDHSKICSRKGSVIRGNRWRGGGEEVLERRKGRGQVMDYLKNQLDEGWGLEKHRVNNISGMKGHNGECRKSTRI